jgi:glycosyltransferase involved in cell wall biosynthesis
MLTRLVAEGIPTRLLPLERSYRLDRAARLALLLRRERVDLLNTHTLFVGNELGRIAAQLARVPVVAHAHIDERYSTRRPVAAAQQWLARRSARNVAAIVAVSEHVKATLVGQGVPERLVTVVHNGVRIGAPPPAPPERPLRVLCAARLAPVKGQAILLDALADVEGVHATIAGDDLEADGAYRTELELRADELDLGGRVEFVGHRDDVPALLEQAHALVLPSLDEGLPMVALEAMERGRIVVASAAGGTPELVDDGTTGLLTVPGDAGSLAAALRRLRDEPELHVRMGAAGRLRVERDFTLEATAARTLAVFAAAAA